MKVKIVNVSENPNPAYQTENSAGQDLMAFLPDGAVNLRPLERRIIPTGLYVEIPEGYEGQIRPRSGISIKRGLTVINAPGTIDSDYRGEIGVPIINLSNQDQVIENGERIAQIVYAPYSKMDIEEVDTVSDLSDTKRGSGGFGHTGSK